MRFPCGLGLPVLSMVWVLFDFFPVLPWVFSPGVGRGSLYRVCLHRSGRFWLLGAGSRPVSPLRSLAPSHSGVCAVRVMVPPCFLTYCGAPWLMALRSIHCRITAGLASMDRPLLVSSVESQLCGCLFVVLPCQLVGSEGLPLLRPFALPLASFGGVLSGSLPRVPRQVFAMGSPFRVEPVLILDHNVDSTSTFLVLVGVFAMGSPCRVNFVSGLDRNEDSLRTFPCGTFRPVAVFGPLLVSAWPPLFLGCPVSILRSIPVSPEPLSA